MVRNSSEQWRSGRRTSIKRSTVGALPHAHSYNCQAEKWPIPISDCEPSQGTRPQEVHDFFSRGDRHFQSSVGDTSARRSTILVHGRCPMPDHPPCQICSTLCFVARMPYNYYSCHTIFYSNRTLFLHIP